MTTNTIKTLKIIGFTLILLFVFELQVIFHELGHFIIAFFQGRENIRIEIGFLRGYISSFSTSGSWSSWKFIIRSIHGPIFGLIYGFLLLLLSLKFKSKRKILLIGFLYVLWCENINILLRFVIPYGDGYIIYNLYPNIYWIIFSFIIVLDFIVLLKLKKRYYKNDRKLEKKYKETIKKLKTFKLNTEKDTPFLLLIGNELIEFLMLL